MPAEDAGHSVQGTGHPTALKGRGSETHDNAVGAMLARATGGERLSGAELTVLFEGASLHQLAAAAHALGFKLNPDWVVTYIVDRNINYTNVCVYRCRFCAF